MTRRVTELERRLDVMKVIVGLVLFGKLLLVVLFFYVLFGHGLVFRTGPTRPAGEVRVQQSAMPG